VANVIRNCTFAFKCDKKWEGLQLTKDANVRFCESCQHEVHFCHTDLQLREAITLNRCITIEFSESISVLRRLTGRPMGSDETPF
jgi:hypothetical protein